MINYVRKIKIVQIVLKFKYIFKYINIYIFMQASITSNKFDIGVKKID
jgi:hypothetical protein